MDNGLIHLKNVTIVSINGRDPENSVKAIDYSSKNISFGKKIIISNRKLEINGIESIKVEGLSSLTDYNIFCITELHKHIETDFCLLVQPDGFVVNPYLWSDFYLQYDYIGAPWDYNLSKDVLRKCNMHSNGVINIVGNGGFSLRSKKLLEECSKLPYNDPNLEEDCFVSVLNRKTLKSKGIKYAPLDLAQQFSMESIINNRSLIGNSFGFHGSVKYYPYFQEYHNLLK